MVLICRNQTTLKGAPIFIFSVGYHYYPTPHQRKTIYRWSADFSVVHKIITKKKKDKKRKLNVKMEMKVPVPDPTLIFVVVIQLRKLNLNIKFNANNFNFITIR